MKLTDYVMQFLDEQGIGHIFGLTGGAVVHIFDSADKNPGIEPVFCHHEQAAALAAVAYARIRNNLGCGLGALSFRQGLAALLQDRVDADELSLPDALLIAAWTGRDNARRLYGLPASAHGRD